MAATVQCGARERSICAPPAWIEARADRRIAAVPEAQRQRPALRIGSLPPWYHATQAGVGATIAASVHGTTYPGHAGDHLAAGRREHRIRQPVRSHEFPDAAAPLRYCALVKLAFIISQGHVATPTGVVTTVTEACGPA
jgi:hypothetical protein